MTTIPISEIVNVVPSVLSAGGNNITMNGVMLTESNRVPFGTVASFPNQAAVASYFGATAPEAVAATNYFNGFSGATQQPGALLVAQYPQTAIAAFMRSGPVSSLTLAQLQALSGSLTLVVDGYSRTAGSINLSGATSFSAAASTIQTALNTGLPQEAQAQGSIGPQTASFNGSIAGNVLTVTSIPTQPIVAGATLTGSGVAANTTIANQLSGSTGGIGTYSVSGAQQVVTGTALTATYGVMTIATQSSGAFAVGQTISGTGITASSTITQLGSATGSVGTYYVNQSQTFATGTITGTPTNIVVTYDSISGSFLFTSGVTGAASMIGFATGTLAASLNLTATTGAVNSQGSPGLTPAAFMAKVIAITQNWASFFTVFDPDGGSAAGNAQKLAFAQWTNGTNNRYAYICWDTDASATTVVPASTSLGQLLAAGNISGTCLIYVTNANPTAAVAAFISGSIASINFNQTNGRATLAFRSQSGLVADVTDPTIATNLAGTPLSAGAFGNFYNFYGAYGSAAQSFIFFQRGTVSGPYEWLDSYVNQIWLNALLQQALVTLLISVLSIPYNAQGYAMIDAALQDVIQQALNFGAFRAGVTLSATQIIAVNNAAGRNISNTLSNRGWYLLVQPATPTVRQARGSPPITFFYMDGQSVQAINLASILLQ